MSDIPDRTIDSIEYRVGYQQGKLDAILNQANHNLSVKQAYEQGREAYIQFLEQWKDDVMNSLCKYDANSVEEVYQLGINRGRAEAITELKDKYLDADSYNEGLDDGITDVLDILERLDMQMLRMVKDVLYEQDYEEQNKKEGKTMICSECGKEFVSGNRPDGLPNGTGFVLCDGTVKVVCTDCIIKKGEESAHPLGYNPYQE